jgi:hypothetical protein
VRRRTITRRVVLSTAPLLALAPALAPGARAESCCGPVTPDGVRLRAWLDGSGVDRLWQAGFHVNWETGETLSRSRRVSTHCSAFVAAFAKSLGIYILRPPDHSQALLANAQMRWLTTDGAGQGWRPLPDATAAQRAANAGELVVASFENPDPDEPGHIAIVRPGIPDAATLASLGPDVTQAGGHNWLSTPLARGFHSHPGAWPGGVKFFAHPIVW